MSRPRRAAGMLRQPRLSVAMMRHGLTRTQQRYDYRLRLLVRHTGDLRLAAAHGVPKSTARGWVGQGPAAVVGLADVGHAEAELRREVVVLRRRIGKLAALLRLALALSHASDVSLVRTRVPEGPRRTRLLRAIDQARTQMPLRGVLRFLGISARRVQAWRRREHACTLGDRSSCPRTSPQRLTQAEVQAIGHMATAKAYRHVPTGRLALLAQRLGSVCTSPSTWYSLVRRHRWRRPRSRVQPKTPSLGVRATRPDELWHIDTTVIRLHDGTRAFLHAVIDNYSRRILAWRVADRSTAANSVAVLLAASGQATVPDGTPDVLADGGVENVNAQVDALVQAGIVRRLLALTECAYSNSLIEAWWRSLKHQWLFLNALDSVATVRRLVAFYVGQHNGVIPHAARAGIWCTGAQLIGRFEPLRGEIGEAAGITGRIRVFTKQKWWRRRESNRLTLSRASHCRCAASGANPCLNSI